MKVLYITSNPLEYSTSANIRNSAIINGLIQNNIEVSTLSFSYNEKSNYIDQSIVKDLSLSKRYWINSNIYTNVSSIEKKGVKKKFKSFLYRIYNKFSIYDVKKRMLKSFNPNIIDETFDIIISSSDPKSSHLIAQKLIKYNSTITKKWIQYWGDPFVNDINNKSLMPKFLIKNEEKKLLKNCDKVIYVSPFTLKKQKETFKEYSHKMFFLPTSWVKEKIYKDSQNQRYRVGYFGDYYSRDRDILPLYEVFNSSDYDLVIYGNSNIKLENKNNIFISNRQSFDIIDKEQANCDLLVCICNKHGTQIPGKVYHYAATNKEILIILDGNDKEELENYFKLYDRYNFCNNDSEDIKNTIIKILQENKKCIPCNLLSCKEIAIKFIN